MEITNNLKNTLINIVKQYDTIDQPLFQLEHKSKVHVDLSDEYPYLEDGSLNENYVKVCVEKAIKVFNSMSFTNCLLVVYDDIYNGHGTKERKFVEGTLHNLTQYDNYQLDWKFPEDDELYKCNRRIYQVEDIDKESLFREIIISDIGGELDLISSIFIIDLDKSSIFSLYDDRGVYIFDINPSLY